MALQRHPELTGRVHRLGHEIASHGWRWIHYQHMPRGDRARATSTIATRVIQRADRRRLAARLVHRPRQPEHAPPGRRARRLRVRQRLLRRRPAVLDAGRRRATARRGRTWSCPTRSTPTTCASSRRRASTPAITSSPTCGRLRRAVRRRRPGRPRPAEDAVASACTAASSAGPAAIGALQRFLDHVQPARPGLDRAPDRHRAPLDAVHPYAAGRGARWPGQLREPDPPPPPQEPP